MNQTMQPTIRLYVLDLFRFLAVLIVVFTHYTVTFNFDYQIVPANLAFASIFLYGHVSLFILFIISGYVVTLTSVNRGLKQFAISRLSRIYPMFWISCIFAFCLTRIRYLPTFLEKLNFSDLLANLTLVPTAFNRPLLNPAFWTLSLELSFYIFIGLIILFKAWNRILIIIPAVLIILLFFPTDTSASVIPRFYPFFLGGVLFYFIQSRGFTLWKLYLLLAVCIAYSVAGVKYLVAEIQDRYNDAYDVNPLIIVTLILLIYLVLFLAIKGKLNIPGKNLYPILGDISYPLYLFHIYGLTAYWYFRKTGHPYLLLLILVAVMTVGSWLLNVAIEKPFCALVRRGLSNVFNIRKPQWIGSVEVRRDSRLTCRVKNKSK